MAWSTVAGTSPVTSTRIVMPVPPSIRSPLAALAPLGGATRSACSIGFPSRGGITARMVNKIARERHQDAWVNKLEGYCAVGKWDRSRRSGRAGTAAGRRPRQRAGRRRWGATAPGGAFTHGAGAASAARAGFERADLDLERDAGHEP